jgi:hypothetical protein
MVSAVVEKQEASPTLPSAFLSLTSYLLGGGALVTIALGVLYAYDTNPWPTIGAACLTYIYGFVGLQLISDRGRDVHLLYFLSSQLFLAYFAKYDPHKGPDGDGPLSSSTTYLKTNKHLRLGLAQFVEPHDLLQATEYACIGSWIMAILLTLVCSKERLFRGWINKSVFTVLCVSYFFLHGIMAGLNGVSHRFYLPAYSFIALLLEVLLGIDSHPYICTFAGFTFVSAGISKLRNSNLSWLDGRALCQHVKMDSNDPLLGTFCATMAPISIFFEVAAPQLMWLGGIGRFIFVLLALSFHLGIAILMFPRYTPQSCSYALVFRTNPTKSKWPLLYGAVCTILLATTVFRIEAWPLTAVPMYSIDVGRDFGSTMEEAHNVARIIHTTGCSSGISFPDRYMRVDMDETRTELPRGCSLTNVGKIKLVKQFMINGLASALVCMEKNDGNPCDTNFWLDKYATAVHEKCQMGYLKFSLMLRDGGRYRYQDAVPVYTWTPLAEDAVSADKSDEQQEEL